MTLSATDELPVRVIAYPGYLGTGHPVDQVVGTHLGPGNGWLGGGGGGGDGGWHRCGRRS